MRTFKENNISKILMTKEEYLESCKKWNKMQIEKGNSDISMLYDIDEVINSLQYVECYVLITEFDIGSMMFEEQFMEYIKEV